MKAASAASAAAMATALVSAEPAAAGPASRPAAETAAVHYDVAITEPATGEATVTVRLRAAPSPLEVAMPVWSPGVYRRVDYGRAVQPIDAAARGRQLAWTRVGRAGARAEGDGRWRIDGVRPGDPVTLRYRITCDRLTEEGCRITAEDAYLNGPALLLHIPALRDAPVTIRFQHPAGWKIATPLDGGPDVFHAPGYDTLVDGPTQIGRFGDATITVAGVRFRMVVRGAGDGVARWLAAALGRIARAQRTLAGPFPFKRYLMVVQPIDADRIFGLEHASSAAVLVPRGLLARAATSAAAAAGSVPLDLQWVMAHELFHTWNAKLLRPRDLVPYDYLREQPSRLLWFVEGATEYFAYRSLRMAGAVDDARYLGLLAGEIGRAVAATTAPAPRTTPEDESEAIWRRSDASTDGEAAFYSRGHVVTALLDLELRARTSGVWSLDRVVRDLAAAAASAPESEARVLTRERLRDRLERAGGPAVTRLFDRWTTTADVIDARPTLAAVGLALTLAPARSQADPGFETERRAGGLRVATVRPDGPAARAGLTPGEKILSIAGIPADESWEARTLAAPPGTRVTVTVERPAGSLERVVILGERREVTAAITEKTPADPARAALRRAWLDGAPHGR